MTDRIPQDLPGSTLFADQARARELLREANGDTPFRRYYLPRLTEWWQWIFVAAIPGHIIVLGLLLR
ncbi:MAG: hypothetical protein ACYDEB_12995 [Dehalococcoidia bacterium]